ncbi:MAG: hypothetical protein AB8H79_16945 [Myxococcota bacterium]
MHLRSIVALALVFTAVPATAAPKAKKLAETDLRDAKDWDVMRLPACSTPGNMPVNRLQLAVTKHPAEIDRLKVTFFDGSSEVLNVRDRFKPGTTSRWIDVPGALRCIKTIRVVGDTDSLGWRPGKQAKVSVWGLKLQPGRARSPRRNAR